MTPLVRIVTLAVFVQMLPCLAAAGEAVPSEREIMQAEGMPPVIPHAMPQPDKNGQLACLACHGEGKNGAPPTPHPERRMCTQCHVPGDVKMPAGQSKGRP